jgi:uncharacterized integral membrane protein (TIGR00697 family)
MVIGGRMTAAPFWDGQEAYARILGYTPRLLAASFAGYLVGEFVNAYILARLKVATGGRLLWLRTISSTVAGQGLDSLVFGLIAFAGEVPDPVLRDIISHSWVFKTMYEVVATPMTYAIVNLLKRFEGADHFDRDMNWSPVSMGDAS